jgi:hypothetical protein
LLKLGKFDENFKFETVLEKLSNLDLTSVGDKNKKIKFDSNLARKTQAA